MQKTAKLGEVADVNWGDTKTTKESYTAAGFPAYSASGNDGFLPYYNYEKTGIVLSAIGSQCGTTWLAQGKWSCIKNTIRFWSKNSEVDTSYLFWLTKDPNIWPKRGSAQPFISQGDARNLVISYPPLPEQRAIAHILGTLDDKIELNRRINETLEAMAQALFKSWFVDFDPVRAKVEGRDTGRLPKEIADLFPDGFEESELGEIPRGWKVAEFGDVANQIRKNIRPEKFNSETPYIGLEHIPRKSIALSDWSFSSEIESNKSEFTKGDILFGKLRSYFHKVGVAPVNGICSTDILVLSPIKPEWFGFVLGHASSDSFVAYTDMGSSGTRMPRTSWESMKRYQIVLPPVAVAECFTLQIKPNVKKILNNIHESKSLGYLRDSLLPKLLSGEIRLIELKEE